MAIPLPYKDVDTDLIYPAQFLTSISRQGCGKNLFYQLKKKDPAFPFNNEKYKNAQILVADYNFGCGSSREHAVWAIYDAGIRVVIAKSFADIFYSNAAKNGLLLVTLPDNIVDNILRDAQSNDVRLTVDLEEQKVTLPDGSSVSFPYDSFSKHCLLNGLDDIQYLQSFHDEIASFFEKKNESRIFSTLSANN